MGRGSTLFCLLLAACGDGGGFPDAPPPDAPEMGTFALTWSVVDQNNQPVGCARIAAQTVTVLVHNLAFLGGTTEVFNCDTGMGTSGQLITGTYEMDFELRSTSGVIATGAHQTGIVIEKDRETALMSVTFQVNPP